MIKQLIFVLMVCMLSSCYVTRTTTDYEEITKREYSIWQFETTPDIDDKFLYKGDDLDIKYSINGKEFKFDIINTTDKAIYVDLARSSLIVNGIAFNYLKTLDSDDRFYYVPSKSTYPPVNFRDRVTLPEPNANGIGTVYTEEKSPLRIRNQITYGFEEKLSQSILVENHIWLAQFGKSDTLALAGVNDLSSDKIISDETTTVIKSNKTMQRTKRYAPGRTAALCIPMAILTAAIIVIPILVTNNNR